MAFPAVAKNVIKEDLYSDAERILDSYVRTAMVNRIELNIQDLKCFPQYKEYIKEHKETLLQYFYKYYDCELCFNAAKGDFEEYDSIMLSMENTLDDFGLQFTEEQYKKLHKYSEWRDVDDDFYNIDEEENLNAEQHSIEEVTRSFKEGYVNEIMLQTIDDIEEWMNQCTYSEDIKSTLHRIMEESEVLYPFLENEAAISFLVLLLHENILTSDARQNIINICKFMQDRTGMSQVELIDFLLSLPVNFQESDENIWIKEELETLDYQIWDFHLEQLNAMTEICILSKFEGWYRLASDAFICMMFIQEVFCLSQSEKESFFKQLSATFLQQEQADASNRLLYWFSNMIEMPNSYVLKMLYIVAPTYVSEYLLMPAANSFYNEIQNSNIECVIKNMIDYLKYEFTISKDGEILAATYHTNEYLYLIEILFDEEVMDIVPFQFNKEQLELLFQKRFIYSKEQELELSSLYAADIIKPLGIYENLYNLWIRLESISQGG